MDSLPDLIRGLSSRWSLRLDSPFEGEDVSCSWVAPATRADGTPVVLKVAMPHMEGEHEIAGLRMLDGNPTVRLLEADDELNAMLLERCEPGTSLRALPEAEQDVVIASLLQRFWRAPPENHSFRPLSAMLEYWSAQTRADAAHWSDRGLVTEGLHLFDELAATATANVLLATDLHAGNVLSATREPWLVIDPKPFIGDPAYDATQHLLNCRDRLKSSPLATIGVFAELLGVDPERVKAWTFARMAAEPREDWNDQWTALAKSVSP